MTVLDAPESTTAPWKVLGILSVMPWGVIILISSAALIMFEDYFTPTGASSWKLRKNGPVCSVQNVLTLKLASE
jgi:hypothetical protein